MTHFLFALDPAVTQRGAKVFKKVHSVHKKLFAKRSKRALIALLSEFFSPTDNAAFPVQHNTRAVGSFLDDDGKNDYDCDIGDVDGDDVGDDKVVKSPQLKAKRTRR